jgi:hypothetical protein
MSAPVPVKPNTLPGVESLKAANGLASQVISVAAGLLAFTVTFAEKFTPPGKPLALPTSLKISWVCFVVTIVIGFWTLLAVMGSLEDIDRGGTETNKKRSNIKIPASLMFLFFLAGVGFLMIIGLTIGS